MSLRALSSLLVRRFSPRRIPIPIGSPSASGRPARSLHALSGPDAAVGALSVAGLAAALLGFLYLKRDDKVGEVTDEGASKKDEVSVAGEVTDEGRRPSKVVVTGMRAAINDPAITAMFADGYGDTNTAWAKYNDYLVFRQHYLESFREHYLDRKRKTSVTDKKEAEPDETDSCWKPPPLKRVGDVMRVDEAAMKRMYEETTRKLDEAYANRRKWIMEQEYEVDEAAMERRFEDWMEEYGRCYMDEVEKFWRYQAFKANAIRVDKLNTHSGGDVRYALKDHGDRTEDELERMMRRRRGTVVDWKSYVEEMRNMYNQGRFDAHRGKKVVTPHQELDEMDCTDAVKKRFRELRARKAEQERQANKEALASAKAGIAGH